MTNHPIHLHLHLTRGDAVYLRHALRNHQGSRDLRLSASTVAVGKVLDAVNAALEPTS